jgi:hypothetical protein
MFSENSFDALTFILPPKGMNQNVSPKILEKNFAYVLENIIPIPLGKGQVRFGTRKKPNVTLPPDSAIIEAFDYTKTDGSSQILLYVQNFERDTTVSEFTFVTADSIAFQSDNEAKFVADTPIKIEYQGENGISVLTSLVLEKTVVSDVVTIVLQRNSFPSAQIGSLQLRNLYFPRGDIYMYDVEASTLSPALKTGFSVACIPRSASYLNKLVICNGVDRLQAWDGTTLEDVFDFVKEQANAFNRLGNTSFSFTVTAAFIIEKYTVGNLIQLKVDNVITTCEIASISRNQNTVTITVTNAQNLPAFAGQNRVELFYRDYPPAFSFLYVAHDRLWALGPGAAGLNYRSPDEALRVYYTYRPKSITDWFNETTKTVPSEDISSKHGVTDNLEAIALLGNYLVFMGRKKTQIWIGQDPTNLATFSWSATLPIGVLHGNLVAELPNDIYFISQNGILSFGTLNFAKQFAASSSNVVDPLVRTYVKSVTLSNVNYRACRTFKYPSGPFVGFKIGFNKVLMSLYSDSLYAWFVFSGDFLIAQTFLTSSNESLYLFIKNEIYEYADGIRSAPLFADRDGQRLIHFMWTLPVIHLGGKRFACKRYEVQIDYPSSFALNSRNRVFIEVNGDIRRTFSIENAYVFEFKGDILGTVPLLGSGGTEDSLGFRFDKPYLFPKGRLKFFSSQFWVILRGDVFDGPVFLDRIRLFGDIERTRSL